MDEKNYMEEEREYILPPHPEAQIPLREETVTPDAPTIADKTLAELVQQAVDGLRDELVTEIQNEMRG